MTSHPQVHVINLVKKTCTCGKWQEYMAPCIDLVAYLRRVENRDLEFIIQNYVHKLHTYEYEKKIGKNNIYPVIVGNLIPDKQSKPPVGGNLKRTSGRAKKGARLRTRSLYDPYLDKHRGKCQECGEYGHNKRTCKRRQLLAQEIREKGSLDDFFMSQQRNIN